MVDGAFSHAQCFSRVFSCGAFGERAIPPKDLTVRCTGAGRPGGGEGTHRLAKVFARHLHGASLDLMRGMR